MALVSDFYRRTLARDYAFEKKVAADLAGRLAGFPEFKDNNLILTRGVRTHFYVCYGEAVFPNFAAFTSTEFGITGKVCEIIDFNIHRDKRGDGYGSGLYSIIENFARDYGCRRIFLFASGDGKWFWPKKGFSQIGSNGRHQKIL